MNGSTLSPVMSARVSSGLPLLGATDQSIGRSRNDFTDEIGRTQHSFLSDIMSTFGRGTPACSNRLT